MEWIYNKYEFENRVNNLFWTISGKYDEDIDPLEDYNSKEVAMYFAIMAGARHKYIEIDIVKKYLLISMKKGYDIKIISNLIHIVLNKIVEEKVIKERPGVIDIREKAYKDIVEGFSKIYKDDLLQKVKYTFVLEGMGKHPSIDGQSRRIVNSIKEIDITKPIIEILKIIDNIYLTYFKNIVSKEETKENIEIKYKDMDIDFDTFSDFMYEELYEEKNDFIENEINNITGHILVESIGERSIKSSTNSANRVIYADRETLDKIYKKMEHYYGKSYLNKNEIKRIETKNCRKIHEGCRIHFTDGVIRSECTNIVQVKYATRQKENNMSKFRDKVKVHKRNIIKLKENLSRILVEESEKIRVYSDNGTIDANRVWRATRSNNKNIFYKDIENYKGKYVIDILLDGSGSQSRNQANVATQAYIISKALTMVNIPNRVMGFSSFMDYTILKRFRDYDDKIESSENIFEYYCTGNNRDGLAIKSTCDFLLDRKEENKILIILSDGKPNDVKIGKDRERSIRGEMSYKGAVGIKDTAKEVRRARQQGILVLGVYTGKESDLEAERLIYGKDFIYTKDIERFSDIVSMYLKKVIRN
jgi:hypothetical protein